MPAVPLWGTSLIRPGDLCSIPRWLQGCAQIAAVDEGWSSDKNRPLPCSSYLSIGDVSGVFKSFEGIAANTVLDDGPAEWLILSRLVAWRLTSVQVAGSGTSFSSTRTACFGLTTDGTRIGEALPEGGKSSDWRAGHPVGVNFGCSRCLGRSSNRHGADGGPAELQMPHPAQRQRPWSRCPPRRMSLALLNQYLPSEPRAPVQCSASLAVTARAMRYADRTVYWDLRKVHRWQQFQGLLLSGS